MVSKISNIPQLRVQNLLSITRSVFHKELITRKEISEATGLALTTVSQLTNELISRNILTIEGKEDSTGGRQPDFIRFNPGVYFVIGISIGVNRCHGIVTDMYGHEIASCYHDVTDYQNPEEFISITFILINKLLTDIETPVREKILGAGISFPGNINSDEGIITDSSLLGGEFPPDFARMVEQEFDIPVFIENNVNLCALNESMFGKVRNYSVVLFIFAGFGIGAGFTIDGTMYLGATFSAGNIGHKVVDMNGRRCYCGGFGCLETIASYSALFEDFSQQVKLKGEEQYYDLVAGNFSYQKVDQIMDEANKGSETAIQIIRNVGYFVGLSIANLLGVLNPDVVIFGGDYLKVKDIIINPIVNAVQSRAWSIVKDTPIEVTDFGMMAEAHGAVSMLIQNFLKFGPGIFDADLNL
jgi:N-acetylglucosamine repressor